MANIVVDNSEALVAAVKAAKNGDVISVSGGIYSSVNLKNIQIGGNITIQSADPAHQAVFTDLLLRDSKGITFRNLEFAADPAKGMFGFSIANSSNIVLDKLNVHGTLDGDPSDDTSPLMIRNSTNVSVTGSEFQQVWHGISVMDSNKVTLTGNTFHDIRTDAIRAGGTSNFTVSGNYFSDFHPAEGDHPDAIQIWSTNAKASASNITITDNVITRGKGDAYQGIFIRDTFDDLPFQKVTITGNTVLGALYNGITVDGAKGVTIDKNIVAGQAGQESWIRVQNATDVAVSNNLATAYTYIDTPAATVAKASNILLASMSDKMIAGIAKWLDGNDAVASTIIPMLAATLSKIGYVDAGTSTITTGAIAFDEVQIVGTRGADRLTVGNVGDSRILAGDGNDTLTGSARGEHSLIGGRGDDIYNVKGKGDIVLEDAGEGTDTVSAYIDYTLTASVETLRMMTGGLTGRGNDLDNRIVGSAGIDTLYGEDGDDQIQGGADHDRIWGGDGADQLKGDDGDDMITGDAGADMLIGGTGHDTLRGGADGDTLKGEDGNDFLYGDSGNDLLQGGAGDDLLDGGAGANTLEGGVGEDRLTGGGGADLFVYRNGDFASGIARSTDDITNFSSAERDRISLSAIDANTRTNADDRFAFIGKADFHKVAGELRYEVSKGDATVYGDTNGDGKADFAIHLTGVTSLNANDFIL